MNNLIKRLQKKFGWNQDEGIIPRLEPFRANYTNEELSIISQSLPTTICIHLILWWEYERIHSKKVIISTLEHSEGGWKFTGTRNNMPFRGTYDASKQKGHVQKLTTSFVEQLGVQAEMDKRKTRTLTLVGIICLLVFVILPIGIIATTHNLWFGIFIFLGLILTGKSLNYAEQYRTGKSYDKLDLEEIEFRAKNGAT